MSYPSRLQMPTYPSVNPYNQPGQPSFDHGASLYTSPTALGPSSANAAAFTPGAYPGQNHFPGFFAGPQPYYGQGAGGFMGPSHPSPSRTPYNSLADASSPLSGPSNYVRASPAVSSPHIPPNNSLSYFPSPNYSPVSANGGVTAIGVNSATSPTLPFRSKLGHATTPSFHPTPFKPQIAPRRPTLTLRPPSSPVISRLGSPSLSATGSAGFREEKKRKVHVKLPWELWEDNDEVNEVGNEQGVEKEKEKEKGGRKRSAMSRRPLDDDTKRQRLELMDDADFKWAEATTRECHFDEERLPELPPSIEIYLPGRECWDDMRQTIIDEKLSQLGYGPSGPGPLSARLNSYIENHNAWPSSSQASASANPSPSHFRSGSLFLPSLPPRLQNAYDSFTNRLGPTGKGHGSSFSVGGVFSKSFTMPSSLWFPPTDPRPENVPLPTSPETPGHEGLSPRPGRDSGYFGTPPSGQNEQARSTSLSKERGRRLTLQELSRGFGIEEEEEGEEEEEKEARVDDGIESRPSRESLDPSMRTAEGSGSDAITALDDGANSDIVTNPSDEEGDVAVPNAQGHVHRASLGTEALGLENSVPLRFGKSQLMQEGQNGTSDSGNEPSEDGDISEGEFSNPSDEERARTQRRLAKAGTWNDEPPNTDHWFAGAESIPVTSGEEENAAVLFQAPTDVDLSNLETMDRERRSSFHFPPRGPLPVPPALAPSRSMNSLRGDVYDTASDPPHSSVTRSVSASALNVAAPEFVFGAPPNRITELSPTFGRKTSTASLGSAGFSSSIGAPGSLAEDSLPGSPTKNFVPHLNPFAGEFKPTFDFKLPEEAPALPQPPKSPLRVVTQTSSDRNAPSVRGPLPPVPLLQTVASHVVKRQKVDSPIDASSVESLLAKETSPGKDNVRGFKFPHGPVAASPQPILINGNALHNTPSPSASIDADFDNNRDEDHDHNPIPLNYTAIGRSTARTPFIADSRPFTLKANTAISPDGRVVGFSSVARRAPIPEFGSRSSVDEAAPTQGRPRAESMDDINLPSISRPRSRAMPILPKKKVLDYGVPKWIAEAQDVEEDDLFGSDAIPLTPSSEVDTAEEAGRESKDDGGDEDDGEHSREFTEDEEEDDDSPLRILEAIIDRQFDSLREELSGFTSLKADLDSLKHDALIDSLVGRMEGILTDSRDIDSGFRLAGLTKIQKAVEMGNSRVQEALSDAVRELKEVQTMALTVAAPTKSSPEKSGLDPSLWIEAFENQRTQLVAAVSDALSAHLSGGMVVRDGPTFDLAQLTSAIEAAISPLKNVSVSREANEVPSTSLNAEALAKLDAAVASFEKAAASLNERASEPAEQHRLSLELETAVATLQKAAIEQSAFPQRVAASVQPLVAGIFDRLADRSDAGDKVVERIIPTLEIIAQRPVQSSEELSAVVCAQLGPLLSPLADLALLPGQVARAVSAAIHDQAPPLPSPVDIETLASRIITELREEQPLATLTTTNDVAKLVEGHGRLDGRTSDILDGQNSLTTLLHSLQTEIGSRFDKTEERLEEQARLVATNDTLTTQISDLENQLAKARNEHGKARSEKAALSERVDAERTTLLAEVASLKEVAQSHAEKSRTTTMEHSLLKQEKARLEDEFREAKSQIAGMEGKLASARSQQEAWHDAEVKHISTLSELQAARRSLEAEAQASSNETSRLRSELEELQKSHKGALLENQKLIADLRLERENAAKNRGEIGALEKRIATQDDKIGNLQRTGASKQQALAIANQRASDLDKRTAELTSAQSQLSSAKDRVESLESQLFGTEATLTQVREDSTAFREQTESELETMKEFVARELQEKLEEASKLKEENERLKSHNVELGRSLELAQSTPTKYNNLHPDPLQRPRTAQPLASSYPTPPRPYFEEDRDVSSSMWAPTPRNANFFSGPPATFLERQDTGETIHRPSSTASRATNRSAKEIPKAVDGWWG